MSYRDLEIWRMARCLVIDVHRMTMEKLPRVEMFEEGAQIRRSMKSVKSTIVEGYGRRRYKQDFIKFLTYAHASCDETIDHLETLHETGSLTDQPVYLDILKRLNTLGAKLNCFIRSVEESHLSAKEAPAIYSNQ